MENLLRKVPYIEVDLHDPEALLQREWLVTNGLGGYASGTVLGVVTRRYHGLLIAALPAPQGRVVMFNHLSERLRLPDGTFVYFGGEERAGGSLNLAAVGRLTEFRLETGLPVWCYDLQGYRLEKRVVLLHEQNTTHVSFRLLSGPGRVRLSLRPSVHFRPHEAPVNLPFAGDYVLSARDDHYELSDGSGLPPLRMRIFGERPTFTIEHQKITQVVYRIEESRGYEFTGDLWCPGYFQVDLSAGQSATLVASTEAWETVGALSPDGAQRAELERRRRLLTKAPAKTGVAAELVFAADQFIISPAGRVEESARARAAGDEVRTVIAGYHWFTDWGRDTMISLEGLTLATGRLREAGYILRTFAHYVRDGLIPNLFPEGQKEGLYHTADATLWYFHALDRYLAATGDRETLQLLLPTLTGIFEHHVRGTRFGIGVDPKDGLLKQGAEGYQLTWMDAKVGDWVVTPRRGKAVEINGLWYNAVRLLEGWVREEMGEPAARPMAEQAERCRRSFNKRFWYEPGRYLFDVVDGEHGDDASCRPNQLLAFSLRHPLLDRERWEAVLEVVRSRLLTPVGLRSLAPGSPEYKPQYYGDLRSRDAAYHQGTVWAWLIGPYVDAWLKVHPQEPGKARGFLDGLLAHLDQACVGSVSEVFDAEAPFMPRGCVAQAWSVAEMLRVWLKTAPEHAH
jgi:predicted glycogen debranching enzyme